MAVSVKAHHIGQMQQFKCPVKALVINYFGEYEVTIQNNKHTSHSTEKACNRDQCENIK
jgi:hypothetical protein